MQQLFYTMKLFLIASLFGIFSCEDISGPYYYRVLHAKNAASGIKGAELAGIIKQKLPEKEGPESYCAELSIVRYSSGKEIYSFSGSEEEGVVVSYGNVALEVMVRVKKHERTLKVFFLKSEAEDTHKVLLDIVHKLGKELRVAENK
jgi:hypothetical protein